MKFEFKKSLLLMLLVSTHVFGQGVLNKPNIIVFLVDDMGWQDTSVPFWKQLTNQNKLFRTPNMERLANKGYKFVNAYANPLCTPSRVSLITGVNEARHKVTSWVLPDINSPKVNAGDVDWNTNGLSSVPNVPHTFYATPLPKILSENGYYTILSGKGHFGPLGSPGGNPKNLGFDVSLATGESSYPASYYGKSNFDKPLNGETSRAAVKGLEKYHGKDVFLTKAITLEALKAVKKPLKKRKPFFLYLAHYAVHTPIQADSHFVRNYINNGLLPIQAAYASMIESMDNSLGMVLDFVEKKDIGKNTVIIFLSDNGGLSAIPKKVDFALGNRNAPLRSGKATVFEGGIRVPFIIRYPGITNVPSEVFQNIQIEDVFSTVLELAGIHDKNGIIQHVDGISLLPYVFNPKKIDTTRALLWHLPHYKGNAAGWSSAVRKGNWKLIYNYGTEKLSLYNLQLDIGEKNNVLNVNTLKAIELTNLLVNLLKDRQATFPAKIPGQPIELIAGDILTKNEVKIH